MKLLGLLFSALLVSGVLVSGPAVAANDATHGKVVFARCAACHSLQPGKKMIGPSLVGIVGRKAGTLDNYAYSPAMKKYGVTWDAKTMSAFLVAPSKTVPGTRMVFVGLPSLVDRADLIAYLRASSK
jgi:cytochrome c